MLNETIPTSIQGVDGQTIGQSNSLNLVNGETTQTGNAVGTNEHKGFIDGLVRMIANLMGKPDPFTGKENISITPKPEFKTSTTTPLAEVQGENQTNTAPKAEEGLFGKFTGMIENIGNKVEIAGEKALGSATNVVNKGLEQAGKVGEQALNQAQSTVQNAANNVSSTLTNAVQLDETTTSNENPQQVSPGPDYFFPNPNIPHSEATPNEPKVNV